MSRARIRGSDASRCILCRLQFPATREEVAKEAYPKTKYDYCRSRVQKHIECFDSILSREKQFILRKEGKRALRKLISARRSNPVGKKDKWPFDEIIKEIRFPDKVTMLKPVGSTGDTFQPVEVKLNKDEYFKQYPYRFYDEIWDALDRLENEEFNKKEEERINTKLCNISGENISAYKKSFLVRWKTIYRKYSIPSKNRYLYQIDRAKLFGLFVEASELSQEIESRINTQEFREFLTGWLVSGIKDKKFTRRTAMCVITAYLRNYENNYEMSQFLFKRFGIKTKVKATFEKHARFGWRNIPKDMKTITFWLSGCAA